MVSRTQNGTLGYIRNMKSKGEVRVSLSSAIVGAHLSIWGQYYLALAKRNEMNWSGGGAREPYSWGKKLF